MKIVHFITSLRTGGAEHLIVDLLPRLREHGHEVRVLLLDGTRTNFFKRLIDDGIPVDWLGIGASAMHNPLLAIKLFKYIKLYRPDIIHAHNTPCQLLAAFMGNRFGAKLVTTEHNTSNRRRQWAWYKPIDRWMYKKYSRIICVNSETKEKLLQSLCSHSVSARVMTVNNGIDLSAITAVEKPALPLENASNRKKVIMVAAFRKQKDQQTLIRAMRYLPSDYTLSLVGDGECRCDCEDLVRTLGLADRVSFLGIRNDIPELLSASDVVVMSSHYEGLSLSSIEGLASGKPFIASDVDGLHDIVCGAGLLFPEGDYKCLAGQIYKVCTDRAYGRQVADSCLQRAKGYDISLTVEGYLHTYETIIKP